jgi:hypothetical protein
MPANGGAVVNAQAEHWFVSDGVAVFGPMPRTRLREAIAEPALAWVRHVDWEEWRAVDDVPELRADEASGIRKTSDSVVVARELAMVIAAPSLREAAAHVLRASVAHLACAGGLLHLADGKHFVTCSVSAALGTRVKAGDAVLVELRGQRAVHAHPRTRARLDAICPELTDAVALPLRARGDLVGAIELAADARRGPFDARDVAFVEQLAAGLSLAPR